MELKTPSLEKPSLSWNGAVPRSESYQDIYYSPDGLAESEFVFIKNNFLAERFSKLLNNNFCIAETGFGTGLNFLATCKLWASENREDKHLHFISFEKYPLSSHELERALAPFIELQNFSQLLIKNYPKHISGFHRLHFSHNISLTLYFGDALEGLQKLNHHTLINAWYFDGFSPKENESLWSEELFSESKKFNSSETTFSTFTSAGHVRRKLEHCGFFCERVKGFGIKREMLRGKFTIEKNTTITLAYSEKPWLRSQTKSTHKPPKSIAIIGSGLAGAWTAYKLAKKGIHVDVYESANEIATGASGNPRGATYFKLHEHHSSDNRFYLDAYLYAIRELDSLQIDSSIWDKSGLIQLNFEAEQNQQISTDYADIAYLLSKEQCEEISGYPQSYAGLYFPDAGSVNPKALCEHLLKHPLIKIHLNCLVETLNFELETYTWDLLTEELSDENSKQKITYDAVIIANSYGASKIEQCEKLPLYQVRGQSTQLASTPKSSLLKTVLCSKGYATPSINAQHTIGSTFDPRNKSTEVLDQDNQINLEYLKSCTPDFYKSLEKVDIVSAKAALRCQTPDMLPITGALPDYSQFMIDYSDVKKGQLNKHYPCVTHLPNLYINVGHASRGLISSPYCAEILVNEICGEVSLCEQEVADALAPSRFYLRSLKKASP